MEYIWIRKTYGVTWKIMIKKIKQLREDTGVGIMDCKKALEICNGNISEAKVYLRKQGIIKAGQRGHKAALDGIIGTYKHVGGRICSIVEINCETDFVARNQEFQNFAHDLAMHISATNPRWISRKDIPQDIIEQEKDILSIGLDKKTKEVKEKIISGKLNKFFKDNCLLEQTFIKDSKVSVQELFDNLIIKLKENIIIKRFSRFEVGQ